MNVGEPPATVEDIAVEDTDAGDLDPWIRLVGQHDVRRRLELAAVNPVHAYLFLGQPGSGTVEAAFGFAALLLTGGAATDSESDTRTVRLAVEGKHPDVVVIESQGSALRVSEADEIAKASLRTPVEGARKVIVVPEVDVIEPAAIGKLLKVIEEPPPSTVFVLLGAEVAPEFVTIASRCVTVDFGPLSTGEIVSQLRAEQLQKSQMAGAAPDGLTPEDSASQGAASGEAASEVPEHAELEADGGDSLDDRITLAASASGGDLVRARLLLNDSSLRRRAQLWASAPARLDGRGATITGLVSEIRSAIDGSVTPLTERHQTELDELAEWVEQFGERGSGRAELTARHKREIRRLRTDELRFGLAVLARHYRDRFQADNPDQSQTVPGDSNPAVKAADIQDVAERLIRNPNEVLLLQGLFIQLSER